jgi:hypothetical protein
MRQGLEQTRYVQVGEQWFFEVLTGFDADHQPVYRRNPTPTKVDLVGERKQVLACLDACGKPVMSVAIVKHPTHTIDANGRLQPFHPPGQGTSFR